ncbi:MAG: type II toxin-antitoxin system HicB family antitoxin [Acidobacteria bacterium]|nr:type II toxin-antitoxin system HicB family antitoxin [Acidobacteriota bacterium]
MKARFLVVLEKGKSNYSAYSPDLPGCIAVGKTVEDTLREMRSAIEFHLEGMLENGERLPKPRSLNTHIRKTGEISTDDILTSIETELPQMAHA